MAKARSTKLKRRAVSPPLVAPRTPDEWERGWQRTWKKLTFVPYELPADDVFAADELGFGHVTDSPREAVDRVVRALPPAVCERLAPVTGREPKQRAR